MNPLTGIFETPAQEPSRLQKVGRFLGGFGEGFQGRGQQYLSGLREQDAQLDTSRQKAMVSDAVTVDKLFEQNQIEPAMDFLNRRYNEIVRLGGDPSDTAEIMQLAASGRVNEARGLIGNFLGQAEAIGLYQRPQDEQDEMISPGMVNSAGQAVVRTPDGGFATRAVEGFTPDATNSNDPAAVREYAFFQSLQPEQQQQYLTMKRANPGVNLGDRTVFTNPANVAGDPLAVLERGVSPESQPDLIGQQSAARTAGAAGGLNLTPAQEAVDTDFGGQYAEFVAAGGYADSVKALESLGNVMDALGSGRSLTGPIIGNVPQRLREIINPESADIQEQVEEVVQRNLRLILGAQFTEREGERLIARAYNPRLDEQTNARRVNALMTQIAKAMESKLSAIDYFEEQGTLQGWEGQTPTMSDFMNIDWDSPMPRFDRSASSAPQSRFTIEVVE